MTGPTATLQQLAQASATDPGDIIEALLDRLDDTDDRSAFLHGLTERVLQLREQPTDDAAFELHRWVGSWWISIALRDDPAFEATDLEAQQLMDAGKLGEGMTGSDLRARYDR